MLISMLLLTACSNAYPADIYPAMPQLDFSSTFAPGTQIGSREHLEEAITRQEAILAAMRAISVADSPGATAAQQLTINCHEDMLRHYRQQLADLA